MARSEGLKARDTALLRLSRERPEDYARLYDEERVKRGLAPLTPRKAERIAELEAQLARLKGET